MKTAKHTHEAFDGTTVVKGWVLEDGYGNKSWVYFNGVDICVHPVSDWYDELTEVENDYKGTDIVETINKIDETQKVVVPKFVAEWIEKYKNKKKKYRLAHALGHVFNDAEVSFYIKQQEGDYTETIAEAWLYGYTVEQEKLYTVEIPDPHGMYKIRYLFRNSVGNIRIGGGDYRDIFLNVETHLTEAEIKKDFEWAWQWAKEVL